MFKDTILDIKYYWKQFYLFHISPAASAQISNLTKWVGENHISLKWLCVTFNVLEPTFQNTMVLPWILGFGIFFQGPYLQRSWLTVTLCDLLFMSPKIISNHLCLYITSTCILCFAKGYKYYQRIYLVYECVYRLRCVLTGNLFDTGSLSFTLQCLLPIFIACLLLQLLSEMLSLCLKLPS